MRSSSMQGARKAGAVTSTAGARLVLALVTGLAVPFTVGAQEPPPVSASDSSDVDAAAPAAAPVAAALDAELSPDGRRVAFRARQDGVPRLFVRDALDTLALARPLSPAGRSIGRYAWAPDSRHVVFADEARRGLWVVRIDDEGLEGGRTGGGQVGGTPDSTGAMENAASQAPSSTQLVADADGPVRIAGFAADPVAVLVELPGRWPDAPDLVRIDLETGARTVVAQNDGGVRRWVPDASGAPRLAVREDEDGGTELVRHREGEVVPVYRCGVDEVCEPVGFHPDGRIWIRTDRDREAPALLLLDPLTTEEEVVRADVASDTRTAFRSESDFAEATSRVRDAVGDDAALTFHRPTADRGRWLVEARGPERAELLLFDGWSGAVTPVLALARPPSASLVAAAPDPSVLGPARLAYRITEDEAATSPIEMVRRIEGGSEDGAAVWRVVDEARVPTYEMPDVDLDALADDPEAVDELIGDDPSFDPFAEPSAPTGHADATDAVVLDGGTLAPIRRRAEGPLEIRLAFGDGRVSGTMETQGFDTPVDVATEGPVWSDGAALETLVATLPLADGYRTRVPVLDTETAALDTVEITVTGTEEVTTPAGSFDVWRLELESTASPDREEAWLVRRGAPHHRVRAEVRLDGMARITELTELTEPGGPS